MYLSNLMNKSGASIVLFYRSMSRLKIGSSSLNFLRGIESKAILISCCFSLKLYNFLM